MKPKKWRWLLPIGAAGAGLGVLAALNKATSAQTSRDAADTKLKTRLYNASLERVRANLQEIVPQLRCYGAAWRLMETQIFDEGTARASCVLRIEVPVTVFVDDLTITLRADGENGANTLVDARSCARVAGKSNFGENRRHVVQLLSTLDEKFAPK